MKIDDLPEIKFDIDIETLISERIKLYEDTYYEDTGERIVLEKSDRDRVIIKTQCLAEYQFMKYVEEQIKNNLLRYARGPYLDNLEPVSVKRFEASSAKTIIRATVAPNENERIVSAGRSGTPNGSIFFENKDPIVIPANVDSVDIVFTCKTAGEIGNGYMPGQISTMVESVPEFLSITNINVSSGGSELEGDGPYRERKVEGNGGTSVAGPADLYVTLAKSYDVNISDVKALSENEGEVTIIVLLRNGELPSLEFMEGLRLFMSAKDKRPMNDKLVVKAPDVIHYDISLTFYCSIDKKSAVEASIDSYIAYQKSVIGRKVNPTTLSTYMTAAGAKRVEITLPIYTSIKELEVAVCQNKNITYGGDVDAT
jgi:phage-related baseplate assembly protein